MAFSAAWLVGIICIAVPAAYGVIFHPEAHSFVWIGVLVICLFPLPVLLPTWLLVLLPYAWVTPPASFLWKRSVLTGIGLLIGPIIVVPVSFLEYKLGLYHGNHATDPWGPLLIRDFRTWGVTSAIVGATAGLVAAWVHSRLGNFAA